MHCFGQLKMFAIRTAIFSHAQNVMAYLTFNFHKIRAKSLFGAKSLFKATAQDTPKFRRVPST